MIDDVLAFALQATVIAAPVGAGVWSARTDRRDGAVNPVTIATAAASALLLLLIGTGVFLHVAYRPTADGPWSDIAALNTSVSYGLVVQRMHAAAAGLGLVAVLATLVLAIARHRRWGAGAMALVTCCAALFSGPLLPWDQLALFEATNDRWTGYFPLYSDNIRFVLIDGRQISPTELLTWLWVHTAAGTAALVLAGSMLWRRSLRADAVRVGEDEQVDERRHHDDHRDAERDDEARQHG